MKEIACVINIVVNPNTLIGNMTLNWIEKSERVILAVAQVELIKIFALVYHDWMARCGLII